MSFLYVRLASFAPFARPSRELAGAHLRARFFRDWICRPRARFTFKRVRMCPFVWAAIQGLFASSSPSAIPRRVRTVIVTAIQGMVRRWAWSHVAQEGCEVGSPFIADSNAATSVTAIGRIRLAIAASFHAFPDSVFMRFSSAVRSIADATHCGQFFAVQASAAAGVAILECSGPNGFHAAAIASARPMGHAWPRAWRAFYHKQSPELPSCEVFESVGIHRSRL